MTFSYRQIGVALGVLVLLAGCTPSNFYLKDKNNVFDVSRIKILAKDGFTNGRSGTAYWNISENVENREIDVTEGASFDICSKLDMMTGECIGIHHILIAPNYYCTNLTENYQLIDNDKNCLTEREKATIMQLES